MSAKKRHALACALLLGEREREDLCTDNTTYHWRADREQKNRNCFFIPPPRAHRDSSFIYLLCPLISRCADPQIKSEALLTFVPLSPGGPGGHTAWSQAPVAAALNASCKLKKVFTLITRAHRLFCFCGMSCVFCGETIFCRGSRWDSQHTLERREKVACLELFCYTATREFPKVDCQKLEEKQIGEFFKLLVWN